MGDDNDRQCAEILVDEETGEERRCKRDAEEGSDYCWQHPLGTGPTSVSRDKIIAAIHRCRGKVYVAAEQLDYSARQIIERAKRDEKIAEAIEHERRKIDEKAGLKLEQAIEAGEAWAIRFRRKQARERIADLERELGIGSTDADGDGSGAPEINVILPGDDSDDGEDDGGD